MSRRVVLLIPDAGPLISFAKAARLDALLALGPPVVVADQVVFEATRDKRHEDARRIAVFLGAHPDTVIQSKTVVGEAGGRARAGVAPRGCAGFRDVASAGVRRPGAARGTARRPCSFKPRWRP